GPTPGLGRALRARSSSWVGLRVRPQPFGERASVLDVLDLVAHEPAHLAVDVADRLVDHADRALLPSSQLPALIVEETGARQCLEGQIGDVLVDLFHRADAAIDRLLDRILDQV